MSFFDSILGQLGGHVDVKNLAEKVGLEPEMAEKAIAALGQSHQMEGDTVELASAKTGIDSTKLGAIVDQIGGEGSLGEFARMLQDNPKAAGIMNMFDRDGDGNPLNDIAGMAKGLFGKK